MKVWELIAQLQSVPAGTDVFVCSNYTLNAISTGASLESDGMFVISCDDLECVDANGEEKGWLSVILSDAE